MADLQTSYYKQRVVLIVIKWHIYDNKWQWMSKERFTGFDQGSSLDLAVNSVLD